MATKMVRRKEEREKNPISLAKAKQKLRRKLQKRLVDEQKEKFQLKPPIKL